MQIHSITRIDIDDKCYLCDSAEAHYMVKLIEPTNGLRMNLVTCEVCMALTKAEPEAVMLHLEDKPNKED